MSQSTDDILIIENMLSPGQTDYLFGLLRQDRLQESKVGTRVDPQQKIRQDYFLRDSECGPVDVQVIKGTAAIVKSVFDVELQYRERWKIGFYDGARQGHYNPHTDVQGNMTHRVLSIIIALSDPADYSGGDLCFPDLSQSFKPGKGTAIIFSSALKHGVNPVIAGERYTLISFMFDEVHRSKSGKNAADYLPVLNGESSASVLPVVNIKHCVNTHAKLDESRQPTIALQPAAHSLGALSSNSVIQQEHALTDAPGKDIAAGSSGSKESKRGDRLLIPLTADSGPGNQIMGVKEALVLGRLLDRVVLLPPLHQHYIAGQRSWDFEEIFKYEDYSKARPIKPSDSAILKTASSHVLHKNYLHSTLKIENLLGIKPAEKLLAQRRIRTPKDLFELDKIDDELLCLKHIFNSVSISECGWNGCVECALAPQWEKEYKEICRELDFADRVKLFGEAYIKEHIGKKFVAVHLRYPDVMRGNKLVDIAGYSEEDVAQVLLNVATQHGLTRMQIFIATNKPEQLQGTALEGFHVYEKCHEDDIEPFIEQYICTQSKVFLLSKFNDFDRIGEPHQRSTWSAFVKDYRQYRMQNTANIPLQDLLHRQKA